MATHTHSSIYCFYTPHCVLTDERYMHYCHTPAQQSISSEHGYVQPVRVSDGGMTLQTKMFF